MERIAIACGCGKRLSVRAELAGTRGRCPGCGALVDIPMPGPGPEAPSQGASCSVCQTMVEKADPTIQCQACRLLYHKECWGEYGGCAAYGCENAPKQEKKSADAKKECPFCGELIAAKALRCPSCRERFEDARPVDRDEYIEGLISAPRLRTLRTQTVALLAGSLVPCFAPIALVIAIQWANSARADFDKAGGVYKATVRASTLISGMQTLLLLVFFLSVVVS